MKKKLLAMATAALLALSVMGVVACSSSSSGSASSASGSGSSASASASASASSASASAASESASAAAPAAKGADVFIGSWDLVQMEMDGTTVSGNITQILGGTYILEINADGTAALSEGDEAEKATWEFTREGVITITDSINDTFDITYNDKDATVTLTIPGEGGGTMVFANEKSTFKAPTARFADAQPIKDSKEVIGTWKLDAAAAQGVYIAGNIAGLIGTDMSFEFTEDGAAKMSYAGQSAEITYEIGSDGMTLIAIDGSTLEVRMLNGKLVLDMGDTMGAESVFLFAK